MVKAFGVKTGANKVNGTLSDHTMKDYVRMGATVIQVEKTTHVNPDYTMLYFFKSHIECIEIVHLGDHHLIYYPILPKSNLVSRIGQREFFETSTIGDSTIKMSELLNNFHRFDAEMSSSYKRRQVSWWFFWACKQRTLQSVLRITYTLTLINNV